MTLYDSSSLAQSEFIGLPFSSAHGAAAMFHSLGCPPVSFARALASNFDHISFRNTNAKARGSFQMLPCQKAVLLSLSYSV